MAARATLAISAALAVSACSRDDEAPKPTGERTYEPVPETPKDASTGPFGGFDFGAAAKRWQGDWVVVGEQSNLRVVWTIVGDRLTETAAGPDGQVREFRFAIYSPCHVSYTDDEAGVTGYKSFTFVGEQVHVGFGATGVVVGESTIVCTNDAKVHVLRGNECKRWSELFDDWNSEPGRCRIEGEGSERAFVVGEDRLTFVGDALLDDGMVEQTASWHADRAAAMAVLLDAEAHGER